MRAGRNRRRPECEGLEGRVVLAGSPSTLSGEIAALFNRTLAERRQLHPHAIPPIASGGKTSRNTPPGSFTNVGSRNFGRGSKIGPSGSPGFGTPNGVLSQAYPDLVLRANLATGEVLVVSVNARPPRDVFVL
jgi:hypothetical protein